MKKKILFLLPMLTMALVFTSCSKDDEESGSFNVSGTSLIGTWAYVDEDSGKLGERRYSVPYYFTLTDGGLLTYSNYWGKTAYYKDGNIYSNSSAETDVRYHVVLKGNELYTDDGLLLARIKVIDSNHIRTFDNTYGSNYEDYVRVNNFMLLSDY